MYKKLNQYLVNQTGHTRNVWAVSGTRILLIALLMAPFITWSGALGNSNTYFQEHLPPGQAFYSLSKLMGLYAIVLLWLQLMYGLLKANAVSLYGLPRWSVNWHRLFGLLTLLTAVIHFLFFFTAASIRTGSLAVHLLVPNFSNGFYTTAVSLGWFALVGLLVVAMIGLLRSKMQGVWLWAHRLSYAVIVLALIHGQLVGSEAQSTAWFYLMLLFGLSVAISLLARPGSGKSPA
jgi:hypothetical protein